MEDTCRRGLELFCLRMHENVSGLISPVAPWWENKRERSQNVSTAAVPMTGAWRTREGPAGG